MIATWFNATLPRTNHSQPLTLLYYYNRQYRFCQPKSLPIIPTVLIRAFVAMMGLSFIIIPATIQMMPPSICRYQPKPYPAEKNPNPMIRVAVATHFNAFSIMPPASLSNDLLELSIVLRWCMTPPRI